MKYTVSKSFGFEAAHALSHLPETHKCHRLHGHSYGVVVFCAGPLSDLGFVVDYADISRAMKPILDELDHQNLNEILGVWTTAENLAAWILERLKKRLPSVTRVDVYETPTSCVSVER